MRQYLINKRLQQLCNDDGYLPNDKNILLFKEYNQDKLNNIPRQDSDARTILILGNQRLVYFVLKSKFEIHAKLDDLEEFSVGQIALVKAVDTYDVNSGIRFVTYACKVIMNDIKMFYRKINSLSNTAERTKIFFDETVQDKGNSDDKLTLKDTIKDDYNFVEEVVDREELNRIIKNIKYLSKNEAFVLVNYYGLFNHQPKSQKEIADILQCSRCNISRCYTLAVEKLKILTLSDEYLTEEQSILKEKMLTKGPQNDFIDTFVNENNV